MTAFALDGVYPPQEDSQLLIDVLAGGTSLEGCSVVDLGTGSGVVAVAAAQLGARSVTAFDICPNAVRCARGNALAAGVNIHVRLGSWTQALECEPFDLVVCNPPYVPSGAEADTGSIPPWAGPMAAWDGGEDGRLVLDPLCATVPQMLSDDGSLLLVQSEFSDIGKSVTLLREAGLKTKIVAVQSIPFGPVLSAHAAELEASGRLTAGRRHELLAVIRADKR
ncbi:methylase [Mycobacterium sp. 852013-50091_SCH5140682]|uniref:HemK2/MTQ2 family protein methyltransferase n=1 Tax=Mycobacterium sp. 852013-50091_SCH5140682 TaxID=1834109 RepID=UPI0007EC10A9|nr:HemK2/MTQ2 family protein methyltransferase [Mycobacterium sp. 852013-50091_SCH5140682]OBC10519.1 methylase [Mycobacterium sp. 852013-50091_SCH5140682]